MNWNVTTTGLLSRIFEEGVYNQYKYPTLLMKVTEVYELYVRIKKFMNGPGVEIGARWCYLFFMCVLDLIKQVWSPPRAAYKYYKI